MEETGEAWERLQTDRFGGNVRTTGEAPNKQVWRKRENRGRGSKQTKPKRFLVAMRLRETPVPIPNTMVKT